MLYIELSITYCDGISYTDLNHQKFRKAGDQARPALKGLDYYESHRYLSVTVSYIFERSSVNVIDLSNGS
jgi:hypothetical protein